MRISTFFYTLWQGIRNIFRNKWFSLASIATIAACLFLFGLFYTILINFQNTIKSIEEGVSITVFFEDGTDSARIEEVQDELLRRTEVSKIIYVSADEAWESFRDDYLGDYGEGFPDNPLENSENLQIYLQDVSLQNQLVTYIESLDDVRLVKRSDVVADMLSGFNVLIGYVSGGIIIILLLVSIFLISNTVMIGISVRKEEIMIMKYIGATDFFVRSPFVIEGIIIGILGSLIPLGIIYVMYEKVIVFISSKFEVLSTILNFMPIDAVYATMVPISMGIGVGIGFLGSYSTVKRHLKV